MDSWSHEAMKWSTDYCGKTLTNEAAQNFDEQNFDNCKGNMFINAK